MRVPLIASRAAVLATLAIFFTPIGADAAPAVTVFNEDFEHNVGAQQTLTLTSYVGAPLPVTYSADPYWLSAADCNGHVVPSAAPAAIPGCSKGAPLQQMAQALGVVGNTPQNHAVAAHTDRSNVHPGVDKVEFRTLPGDPIPLGKTNRFILFSVDVAATRCDSNHPLLKFFLLDGTAQLPAFTAPIDPCGNSNSGASGRFFSNLGVLNTSPTIGVLMRNGQGNANGNDHAFDNITILDATPQLSKAFGPTEVAVGGTSTLTFTITNTDERAAKPGWFFTDTLPAGLTVASSPTASTNCPNGVVTAAAGGASVTVTGDLGNGQAACTATVAVTSTAPGTYANGAGNLMTVGLDPPPGASVMFALDDPPARTPAGTPVAVTTPPAMASTGSPSLAMIALGALAIATGASMLAASQRRLGH